MADGLDVERLKGLLDKSKQAPISNVIPPKRMAGIIHAESSGRPAVIGDVKATAGESRGLMQIQARTAKELYKKGLLPKTWNGKKVKKNRLPELLLDPEFNKIAGSVLYQDNKRILRKKAQKSMIPVSEQELDDLATKAHNQGVTRTIKRDLLKEEPLNPKVQEYLKKMKEKQGFQDGGIPQELVGASITPEEYETMLAQQALQGVVAEPEGSEFPHLPRQLAEDQLRRQEEADAGYKFQAGGIPMSPDAGGSLPAVDPRPAGMEAPAGQNLNDPYRNMMEQYEQEKKDYAEKERRARIGDFASKALSAFGKYGAQRAAAKAQIAGGMRIDAPEVDIPTTDLVGGLKQPNLQEYIQKVRMMKDLEKLKTKKGSLSSKPGSEASKTAREQAKFLTGKEFPDSFTEAQISKIMSPLARKIESEHQRKRLGQAEKRITQGEKKIILSKDRLDLSKVKHGYTVSEDDEKDALTYQKMATQHPSYKYSKSIEDNMGEARAALAGAVRGDETALKTLGVKLAKAFGEKGALSESDVTRYIQSASVLGLIKSKGAQYKDAKITPEVAQSIERILADMEINSKERLNKAYVSTANRFSRSRKTTSPLSFDKALFLVNPDYQPEQINQIASQPTYSNSQIKKAAEKSFGGDIKAAKRYYESKGYRAE